MSVWRMESGLPTYRVELCDNTNAIDYPQKNTAKSLVFFAVLYISYRQHTFYLPIISLILFKVVLLSQFCLTLWRLGGEI